MSQQTITDRIKGWIEAGVTNNAEIASLCGCTTDYVRAIKKRIREPGYTNERRRATGYDKIGNAKRKERYATDLEYRSRMQARESRRMREKYRSDPAFRARLLERQALYRQKRRERAA